MFSLLSKLFIKDYKNYKSPSVRRAYGILSGAVGIGFNILLFIGKFLVGLLTGSIAATADAFNNLSDAGSSVVTMIGFKLSGKKADSEHPFGHGRIEYITGIIIAFLILLMGFELSVSSVKSIISPEKVEFSVYSVVVLTVSILVKLYMALYNRRYADRIDSPAMKAASYDSFSDIAATTLVLISVLISAFSDIQIDGYAGLIVAAFILYSGIKSAKETITPLLGVAPTKEFVNQVISIVMSHDMIVGTHDLVVHDYGPGRLMITLHAEVPSNEDIMYAHEVIDDIEADLSRELGCEAVIHLDPIDTENEHLAEFKRFVAEKASQIDADFTIHDFRMVPGRNHTNLIFDMTVPFECKLTDDEIKDKMSKAVLDEKPSFYCVIKIDKPYV